MKLTTKKALTAYAAMMNSCDSSKFEKLLADDLVSTSQAVLTNITSKAEFVTYIRQKLKTIKESKATVYAELGELNAFGHTECVVMAQNSKDNLVGTAFITIKDNKIKQIDLCSVPSPSQAIRSGIYPKIEDENSYPKTFVSYASKFDVYVGNKNWSELSLEQRKTIVISEFTNDDLDIKSFVMNCGLKKSQYEGLRALYVTSFTLNEQLGFIKEDTKSDKDINFLLSTFSNTKLYKELSDLISNRASELTEYDGVELEKFRWTGLKERLLDETFEMTNSESRRFIKQHLEPLNVANSTNEKNVIKQTKANSVPHIKNKSNKSFFDFFVCAEVRWVKEEIRRFFNHHNYICSELAMKEALQIAGQADKTKYSIRVDGLKPQEIALIIISNVAFNQLIRGKHHIYRNTLSLNGKDYLKLFNDSLALSVVEGYTTKDDAKERLDELMAFIKNLG